MRHDSKKIKYCDKCRKTVLDHENLAMLFLRLDIATAISSFSSSDRHILCSMSRAQHILHKDFPKQVDNRPNYDRRKMKKTDRKKLDKAFTTAWIALQVYHKKMKPPLKMILKQWLQKHRNRRKNLVESLNVKKSEGNLTMQWAGLEKHCIELNFPLLVVKGSKGFLACAYINSSICSEKTQDACGIVSGVKTFDDMLSAELIAVSEQGRALGLTEGMTGQEALELLR